LSGKDWLVVRGLKRTIEGNFAEDIFVINLVTHDLKKTSVDVANFSFSLDEDSDDLFAVDDAGTVRLVLNRDLIEYVIYRLPEVQPVRRTQLLEVSDSPRPRNYLLNGGRYFVQARSSPSVRVVDTVTNTSQSISLPLVSNLFGLSALSRGGMSTFGFGQGTDYLTLAYNGPPQKEEPILIFESDEKWAFCGDPFLKDTG